MKICTLRAVCCLAALSEGVYRKLGRNSADRRACCTASGGSYRMEHTRLAVRGYLCLFMVCVYGVCVFMVRVYGVCVYGVCVYSVCVFMVCVCLWCVFMVCVCL